MSTAVDKPRTSPSKRDRKKRAKARKDDPMPIETIVSGDAVHFPKNGDSCLIHYIGYLENGTEFDNSYRRDRPLCVLLGADQLISGLEKTITKMSRGQKGRVVIPQMYAYGEKGYPPVIPPLASLTYEVELISFSKGVYQTISREPARGDKTEVEKALQIKNG